MPRAKKYASKQEYLKAYYIANREKIKARMRVYNAAAWKNRVANETQEEREIRLAKARATTANTKPWLTRRKRRPIAYLLNVARQRAKARGVEFCITETDLVMPENCPLLGVKLDSYADDVDVHPSIDRIDPKLGYVPGNVWVISHRANRIKSNASAEELIRIGEALRRAFP